MKNHLPAILRPFYVSLTVLLTIGVSSCSNEPQRLLFSNHPTEYKKAEKAVPAITPEENTPLTASAAAEPTVVLPANAYASEKAKTEKIADELIKTNHIAAQKEASKITLKEKMSVMKTALKEVKAAKKEIKQLKKADVKATKAGPVSNDLAIKIIILGLIVALLGLIVPVLGGLGGLIVIVGLVLLLLNYL